MAVHVLVHMNVCVCVTGCSYWLTGHVLMSVRLQTRWRDSLRTSPQKDITHFL